MSEVPLAVCRGHEIASLESESGSWCYTAPPRKRWLLEASRAVKTFSLEFSEPNTHGCFIPLDLTPKIMPVPNSLSDVTFMITFSQEHESYNFHHFL